MADLIDLAIANHELRLPHGDSEGRLAALEARHDAYVAELAGVRAELAAHSEGEDHHLHAEEEFELAENPTLEDERPEPDATLTP